MDVVVLFNEPVLPPDHPDHEQEAGVLASVEAVDAALLAAGHHLRRLPVGADPGQLVAGLSAPWRPAVVVNLCEGLGGTGEGEAAVAGVLELMGLAFTGSPAGCLALVRDKALTKTLLRGAGLPTPDWVAIEPGEPLPVAALEALLAGGPVIAKPACEDASLGIGDDAVARGFEQLARRVADLQARFGKVLVEHFVDGRELNAGWVALPEPRVLPLAEIRFADGAPRLVSYDAKWTEDSPAWAATPVDCPASLGPALQAEVERIAAAAAALTGCRDYARVDLRIDTQGHPWILEVNANPDLGPDAGLARMLGVAGTALPAFYQQLVATAGARAARRAPPPPRPLRAGAVPIRGLRPEDLERLVEILALTGAFRPDEVDVGREVLEEALRDGPGGHYQVRVAEHEGQPVGWTAYGLVPLTDATWDLYWIAVDPTVQGLGVGRALLADCEADVAARSGRMVLAETSGTDAYEATCAFYRRCGYTVVSHIPDFYRVGDARVTYGKRVDG